MPPKSPFRLPVSRRLRRLWQWGLLAVALSCTPGTAPAALFYKVEKALSLTDAALNPNADGTIPMSVTGLNAAGRMTGFFPSANGNKLHAFVWDNSSHTFTDLNALLAADSSMATCINDDGTVAGIFWTADGTYAQNGFLYQPGGTLDVFTAPDGGGGIETVTGIGASGSLVGTYAAGDGTTRGFLVQQAAGVASILDLGDSGSNSYREYVWPVGVNTGDQVAGNVYLIPKRGSGLSYTKGFLWDSGTFSLIEAPGLSANTQATALNNAGVVAGLYGLGYLSDPFTPSGSFLWDGTTAAALGTLGGSNGASVFALDDDNTAFGTSLNGSGVLHLFDWSDAGVGASMHDMGSVSLFAGDQSFQPISLSEFTVAHRPGGGVAPLIDLAGFGMDAGGNTRSLLWKDGAIHSVIDLLPAYLSFTAISFSYGSRVLVNSAEQIACAGTNTQGQQMALLLSLDPDTDNDGLPDSWEMQYFGHLGVDLNALSPGASGVTNWEAYQQGVDPTYSPPLTTMNIVSGDNQTAGAGGFVPQALTVQMTVAGQPVANAPVTFTVTQGGGSVQATTSSTPAATVTATTNASGTARTFFQLPNTPSSTCQISAATGSGAAQILVTFTENSGDGSYNVLSTADTICHMRSRLNDDGSQDLSWENNTDEPTPIWNHEYDGSWTLIMTVPAGQTSCHVLAP